MDAKISAQSVMERCDILGQYSEEPGLLVRRFASPAMRQVNERVAAWMRAVGMSVHQDGIGNLIGRYEADHPQSKTFLLGSHLDTVRDAGKYDGPLGVLIALSVVERLRQRGEHLPFALEILGFADEEGLRYHSAYLGSKAVAGTFDPAVLHLLDSDGMTMAEAIRAFGSDPENIASAHHSAEDLLGYCEVHIEQGPVLESLNLPVGLVSAIAGQSRIAVRFTGEAGHAGTMPMTLRHDALCAAAEFVLAIEAYGRGVGGLVATVGQLTVQPGASNVIPGLVTLSLDVRHQEDATRKQASQYLETHARKIATERGVILSWTLLQENRSIRCAPDLTACLGRAIESCGLPLHTMPSGAGHDAVAISDLTDVAMLFVRCRGGISHNPAEAVMPEDVAVAVEVLERFLYTLAQTEGAQL